MILFVILICLGLQHFFASRQHDRFFIFRTYSQAGQRLLSHLSIENGWAGLILLLIPVFIVIAGINYALSGVWFNALNFLFNVAVLYYCLGACNMRRQLRDYLYALEHDNAQTAYYEVAGFLNSETPADRVTLIRAVTGKIFSQADRYIFSVLFWYILLGPTAVAIYAITDYLSSPDSAPAAAIPDAISQAAAVLRSLLGWIPARISGLSYAFVGHFAYAIAVWRKGFWKDFRSSSEFAAELGLAALELDQQDTATADVEENQRALDLVERAVILWLAVIAVLTLFSWIA